MKLLVFSDSHGYCLKMLSAIEQREPDMILHLGDGGRDVSKIEKQFPQIPLRAVCGNCDLGSFQPETDFFQAGKTKIFLTHGHLYGVNVTLSALVDDACARGADIVMFGHTHIAKFAMFGGIYVLNPGTCGLAANSSCAEVIIDDRGEISCEIIRL